MGWMFTSEQIGHLKKVTTIACVYLYRALPPVLSSFHEYIDFIHTKFCYIITYPPEKFSIHLCFFSRYQAYLEKTTAIHLDNFHIPRITLTIETNITTQQTSKSIQQFGSQVTEPKKYRNNPKT